jgi:hypothetical protein
MDLMTGLFLLPRWAVTPAKLLELIRPGELVSIFIAVSFFLFTRYFNVDGGAGAIGAGGGLGDLAQAQAQLQSLQQFRAASGGHHQKMASFSFPNMLPNVMAANMMGLNSGGYNLLQQQQQQFQVNYITYLSLPISNVFVFLASIATTNSSPEEVTFRSLSSPSVSSASPCRRKIGCRYLTSQ